MKIIFILMQLACMAKNTTKLVSTQDIIPTIVLDIRYATTNNFTKTKIYSQPACYLLEHVAHALKNAHDEFKQHGYLLKIYDGYRPISAQRTMWNVFPDPRYVSDPDVECGRHTRGTTVDVTLVNRDGTDVDMPTEFDAFEEKAHSNFQGISVHVKKNRDLLQSIMKKHGFKPIRCEWWHFDYKGWEKYPPLDISFEQLST